LGQALALAVFEPLGFQAAGGSLISRGLSS
jgi:hypothetical protein